jgi:hypothetical protein
VPGAWKSRVQGSGFRKKRENMSLTENTEAQSSGKNLKAEKHRTKGLSANKISAE